MNTEEYLKEHLTEVELLEMKMDSGLIFKGRDSRGYPIFYKVDAKR